MKRLYLQGGDLITFRERSPPANPFYLCYQFAGEPFKLYKNFPLFASDVVNISVNVGDNNAAVVQYQKNMVFHGTNIRSGDMLKFVTSNSIDHQLCSVAPPEGSVIGPKVNDGILEITGPQGVGSNLLTFGERSNGGSPFKLCYQFLGEPFVMMSLSLGIDVRDVVSVEASAGKYNEIVYAII